MTMATKPVHYITFIPGGCFKTACGIILAGEAKQHATALRDDVTCKRCLKSKRISPWPKRKARTLGAALSMTLACLLLVACGGDEFEADYYGAGGSAAGAAGMAGSGGSAGATGGSAGSAGIGGAAGSVGGSAGAPVGGAAGSAGLGGSGSAGMAGSGGSAGATGGSAGSAGIGGAAGSVGGSAGAPVGGAAGSAGLGGSGGSGGTSTTATTTLPDGFAIDDYEVTRSQYDAWLATSPSTTGQQSTCGFNTSFAPDPTCMGNTMVCDASQQDCSDYPQVCVDWCDAQAYCVAQGGHLCGHMQGGAPGNAYNGTDVDKSQWYYACTSDGSYAYPYGNTYDSSACSYASCLDVGFKTECVSPVSPYAEVHDLSGNVREWTNECETNTQGKFDKCMTRGGSFMLGFDASMTRCDTYQTSERISVAYDVGFRCCYNQ
jgi:sulfatase modifying factor 1